jgi:hypothetical protein
MLDAVFAKTNRGGLWGFSVYPYSSGIQPPPTPSIHPSGATPMISREQLKNEIDTIDDTHLEVLYRIILAFKPSPTNGNNPTNETAIEQDL